MTLTWIISVGTNIEPVVIGPILRPGLGLVQILNESDECPTRHTGAAFHISSNRVDVPPRSIPVGLPKMVDGEHRLVNHQIQLTNTRHTNSVCGHLGHQWVVLDAYTYLAIFNPRELQWFQDLCCCLLHVAQFGRTVCGSQIYCLGCSSRCSNVEEGIPVRIC